MSLPLAKSTVMLTLALSTLFEYLRFLSLKMIDSIGVPTAVLWSQSNLRETHAVNTTRLQGSVQTLSLEQPLEPGHVQKFPHFQEKKGGVMTRGRDIKFMWS